MHISTSPTPVPIHYTNTVKTFASVHIYKYIRIQNSLEELVNKRDSYATDLEQFHDLIDQMDQHVAKLKEKKNNQSEELEETSKNFAAIASKVEKLKESVGNQELSLDDVQKMQNEPSNSGETIILCVHSLGLWSLLLRFKKSVPSLQ